MAHQERPRHYVSPVTLAMLRPALRHSATRDAFVLRIVGGSRGPVLRHERRRRHTPYDGVERRLA